MEISPASGPAPGTAADLYLESVGERLAAVQARIAAACAAAGRAAGSVQLVAVSKTHPREAVQAVLGRGQHLFGENRVQEAGTKFAGLKADWPGVRLHIIGGLQTNKARDAVRIADVIESLDRPRLADALATAVQAEGRCPDLLVQVNTGEEPQKAGVMLREADAFVTACLVRFGPALRGLMCIPPVEGDPTPHFLTLAAMAARHGLGMVSMGMSGDYMAAVAAGATHVRVGSAIFGQRSQVV